MLILATIIALGIVIFIHECGHLWAAKHFGIGVHEFSVGMGPKVWGTKYNGTEYNLRAFPFGGFVKLAGLDEDGDETIPDHLNYRKKPLRHRAVVIAAGSIMNLILGVILFTIVFWGMGRPESTNIVSAVFPDTPAQMVGLQKGDRIISVNGNEDVSRNLPQVIQESNGNPVEISFNRNNQILTQLITPQQNGERFVLGVKLEIDYVPINLFEAAFEGGKETIRNIKMVFVSLDMLISGDATLNQMTGPVGIVQFASSQLDAGFLRFLNVMGLITISLGVINLFPFPVLDGGHLFFLGLESLRGKPVSKKTETWIGNVGSIALISLMMVIIFNDVINWGERDELFKTIQKSATNK